MYDLDPTGLSSHELRVLKALSDFITHHQPESSLSAIDNIVLMYVVGVLEDVGNEDDFDVDNFIEMIAAYVPGFQAIDVAVVCEWIFELSEKLKTATDDNEVDMKTTDRDSNHESQPQAEKESVLSSQNYNSSINKVHSGQISEKGNLPTETFKNISRSLVTVANASPDVDPSDHKILQKENLCRLKELEDGEKERLVEDSDEMPIPATEDKLLASELKELEGETSPEDSIIWESSYSREEEDEEEDQFQMIREIVPDASHEEIQSSLASCGGDLEEALEMLVEKMTLKESRGRKRDEKSDTSLKTQIIFKAKPNNKKQKQRRRSKNQKAKRDRNPSHQETLIPGTESNILPSSVTESSVNEENERILLELFPAASHIDVQQSLSVAKGDIEVAVQLLMEKVNSGEVQRKSVTDPFPRSKVIDDKTQRELLLQKYAFVDAEDHTKEHRPFLPKSEKKKLVRYYDSKPVTNKGEKFFELKGT
ncbi:putative CUE domain-containing protein 2-B [Apostichopus japonicus]|uniref:Putative CUE domain-containing protein 2-B n=1 Tax=Stichopus japonicus TaxID=307972 RepID=A0A2G8JQ23_STIJA|nr:putative CUE domain-containing protein 2-B [Apostichopus japonicus]